MIDANKYDYFSSDCVTECIIDEKNRKVVLKFWDGTIKVAQACEDDTFNPEVGVLWAAMKYLMEAIGSGSAYDFVEECLAKDAERKMRVANYKKRPLRKVQIEKSSEPETPKKQPSGKSIKVKRADEPAVKVRVRKLNNPSEDADYNGFAAFLEDLLGLLDEDLD